MNWRHSTLTSLIYFNCRHCSFLVKLPTIWYSFIVAYGHSPSNQVNWKAFFSSNRIAFFLLLGQNFKKHILRNAKHSLHFVYNTKENKRQNVCKCVRFCKNRPYWIFKQVYARVFVWCDYSCVKSDASTNFSVRHFRLPLKFVHTQTQENFAVFVDSGKTIVCVWRAFTATKLHKQLKSVGRKRTKM